MAGGERYELQIDAFLPETIPMARLSEYMLAFAELLGSQERVHFEGLRPGSLSVVSVVEPVAQNKVARRLEEVRFGVAPKQAMEAFQRIDEYLAADNAAGRIWRGQERVIEFAGRNRPVESALGPIVQQETLVGEVIQIGGRDETINVHIRSGDEIHRCITTKSIARRMGHHLFGAPVRVQGRATWSRSDSGKWRLHRFEIDSFEPLSQTRLSDLFTDLRARLAPPHGGRPNPVETVRRLREE